MANGDESGSGAADKSSKDAATSITLGQAVLAPLDAIFQAQVHAARSFLNMILQLGYAGDQSPEHPLEGDEGDEGGGNGAPPSEREDEDNGEPKASKSPKPPTAFMIGFNHEHIVDSRRVVHRTEVPAISLVPIAPLAVSEAEFSLEMSIQRVADRDQMQEERCADEATGTADDKKSKRTKRPWYLVEAPKEMHGTIAPPSEKGLIKTRRTEATIKINIKVAAIPMPAGLDRLLTAVGHMTSQQDDIWRGEKETGLAGPEGEGTEP